MAEGGELHLAVGSAAALRGETGDVLQNAHIHTGLLQPVLQPRPAVSQPGSQNTSPPAQLGGTSRAGTPTQAGVETHHHTHVLETHTIKLPEFDRNSASLWFQFLETQFRVRRITSDHTKYFTAASKLPHDLAAGLALRGLTYLDGQRYESLKRDVLRRCTKDRLGRAMSVVNTTMPADMDPYAPWDEMSVQIQGEYRDVFVALWLSGLPQWIQDRVEPAWIEDIDTLLDNTQSLWHRFQDSQNKRSSQSVSQATAQPARQAEYLPEGDEELSDTEQLCESFTRRAAVSQRGGRNRGRGRGAAGGQSRAKFIQSDPDKRLCDLHYTFGAQAEKCHGTTQRPCRFKSGNGQAGR